MRKYFDFVQSGTSGRAVSGASVTVTTYPGGTAASLFTDAAGTIPASNPLTTDKTGYYEFYTADGSYTLQFSGAGMKTETITNVQIYDITDVPLTATLAASSGSSLVGFLQAGTGAVARTLQDKDRDVLSAKDFGAVGDGVTDDTAAIQAAATYCGTLVNGTGLTQTRRPVLWLPNAAGYLTSSMVNVPGGVSVVMDGPMIVKAAAAAPIIGLRIGNTTTVGQNWRALTFDLDVRRQTQSDWSSESDIGVQMLACFASKVYLRRHDNFCIGVQFCGTYNNVTIGEFRNNKFGLDVTGTAYNFTTYNNIYGGEIAVVSGVNNATSRYGIRVSKGTQASSINTLTFKGQSYELNATAASPGEAVPLLIADTITSDFEDQRTEGNSTIIARLTGDCRWVKIEDSYSVEVNTAELSALDDQSTYKIGNKLTYRQTAAPDATCIFDTGLLSQNIVAYDGTGYFIRDMENVLNTNPATFQPKVSSVTFNADGSLTTTTNLSSQAGTRLNVSRRRNITIEIDSASGSALSIAFVLFDASGTQLTANTDLLQGQASTPTVTPNLGVAGGLYSLTTGGNYPRNRVDVTFSQNVATAYVGIGGSNLFGWRIYAQRGCAHAWVGTAAGYKGELLASQAPAIGTYSVLGMRARRYPAAVGSPKAWTLTVAGTPGTWVSEGNL